MTSNEKKALALTGIGHGGCHFAMLMFPTAAVTIAKETEFSTEQVLGCSFFAVLLFGCCALPIGYIADRLKANWMVKFGVLALGPALMLVGLSDPHSQTSLTIFLAIVGVLASVYHPSGMSLLSRNMTKRGAALGINGICGIAGIAGAPIVTDILVANYGWRNAYFLSGFGLLLLGLPFCLARIEEETPQPKESEGGAWGRIDLFCVLLAAMMFGGLSYRANTTALPAYFAERFSPKGFGIAAGLIYLVGSLGQFVGGKLADRFNLKKLYMCCHMCSIPFALLMYYLTGYSLLAVSGFFIFFMLGMQPIENSLVAQLTPARLRSTAYGIKFVFVFGGGAFAVVAVEKIAAAYSLAHVYLAITGGVIMMFAFTAILVWMSRDQRVSNPT